MKKKMQPEPEPTAVPDDKREDKIKALKKRGFDVAEYEWGTHINKGGQLVWLHGGSAAEAWDDLIAEKYPARVD